MGPRLRVAAPEALRPAPAWLTARATTTTGEAVDAHRRLGALHLPAVGISDTGVIDLGGDGLAVVAVASTVTFTLRTPAEQDGLVAGFGRYLHSMTAPVQLLVRTERLDLSGQIAELRQRSGGLAHPALQAAALEHADYLAQLGEHADLLGRQVLLVLREPVRTAAPTDSLGGPSPVAVLAWLASGKRRVAAQRGRNDVGARRAAQSRLVRRLAEAVELLAPTGIVLTVLDAGQTTAVLAAACNPDTLLPPGAALAGADEVITAANGDPEDGQRHAGWRQHYSTQADQDGDGGDADDGDWDDEDEYGTDTGVEEWRRLR